MLRAACYIKKTLVGQYQNDINDLLHYIKKIARACGLHVDVVKLHPPYHWADKSLERKLGKAQKKCFPLTNGKDGAQICNGPYM